MAQVQEILTGTVDGANVTFTSSQIPQWGTLHVFVDGVEVTVTSFSETTITLAAAPAAGIVFAVYTVKPNEETALDLIADALIEIGVGTIEDRENIAIADLNIGLRHLNRLLASTNLSEAACYTTQIEEFTLTVNDADYSIGVDPAGILTADFNTVRPADIKNIVVHLEESPDHRTHPLDQISQAQWLHRPSIDVTGIPTKFFYEKSYPFGVIHFLPTPADDYTVELWTNKPASQISDIYNPVSFPEGYYDFFFYQLAVRLCSPFGKSVTPELSEMERRAIARITGHNVKAPLLTNEAGLLNGGGGQWDWRSGEVK